jgi:hypothetical protein
MKNVFPGFHSIPEIKFTGFGDLREEPLSYGPEREIRVSESGWIYGNEGFARKKEVGMKKRKSGRFRATTVPLL